MTRVVIVGEIYNADLSIGGGPMPGGPPGGHPAHPIYNPAYPAHPIYNPPPGIWGGPPLYPDQGLPGSQPGNGGTPVPEDVYTPAPIPEELASQRVVSTYDPRTTIWTTKSYPPR